jgi:hypothetical protein
MNVYCHGWFRYTDIFGKQHTTVFCQRYDPGLRRFVPDGGKERNHRD